MTTASKIKISEDELTQFSLEFEANHNADGECYMLNSQMSAGLPEESVKYLTFLRFYLKIWGFFPSNLPSPEQLIDYKAL